MVSTVVEVGAQAPALLVPLVARPAPIWTATSLPVPLLVLRIPRLVSADLVAGALAAGLEAIQRQVPEMAPCHFSPMPGEAQEECVHAPVEVAGSFSERSGSSERVVETGMGWVRWMAAR